MPSVYDYLYTGTPLGIKFNSILAFNVFKDIISPGFHWFDSFKKAISKSTERIVRIAFG